LKVVLTWALFPIWFLLSAEGLNVVKPPEVNTIITALLNIVAKGLYIIFVERIHDKYLGEKSLMCEPKEMTHEMQQALGKAARLGPAGAVQAVVKSIEKQEKQMEYIRNLMTSSETLIAAEYLVDPDSPHQQEKRFAQDDAMEDLSEAQPQIDVEFTLNMEDGYPNSRACRDHARGNGCRDHARVPDLHQRVPALQPEYMSSGSGSYRGGGHARETNVGSGNQQSNRSRGDMIVAAVPAESLNADAKNRHLLSRSRTDVSVLSTQPGVGRILAYTNPTGVSKAAQTRDSYRDNAIDPRTEPDRNANRRAPSRERAPGKVRAHNGARENIGYGYESPRQVSE
jgi:hypothetical protein